MKMSFLFSGFAASVLLAFLAPAGQAQTSPSGILNPGTGFAPTLNFTDSYSEKLITIPDPDTPTHDVASSEQFSAKIVADLSGFDFAELDDAMSVGISVGSFAWEGQLSDLYPMNPDGTPKPADLSKLTNGTYYYTTEKLDANGDTITDRNGNPVLLKLGSVKFAWTRGKKQRLTVTVSVPDITLIDGGTPLSDLGVIGEADPDGVGGSMKFSNQEVPVTVTFGSAQGENVSYAKGITKTVHKVVSDGDFGLNSATATGSAAK